MSSRAKKPILNLIASGITSIFNKKMPGQTTTDLKKAEFKTSTQKLGVRFDEKIRDIFRFRWIRKKDG